MSSLEKISAETKKVMEKMMGRSHGLLVNLGWDDARINRVMEDLTSRARSKALGRATNEWKANGIAFTAERYVQLACRLMWDGVTDNKNVAFPYKFTTPKEEGPIAPELLEALGRSEVEVNMEMGRREAVREAEEAKEEEARRMKEKMESELSKNPFRAQLALRGCQHGVVARGPFSGAGRGATSNAGPSKVAKPTPQGGFIVAQPSASGSSSSAGPSGSKVAFPAPRSYRGLHDSKWASTVKASDDALVVQGKQEAAKLKSLAEESGLSTDDYLDLIQPVNVTFKKVTTDDECNRKTGPTTKSVIGGPGSGAAGSSTEQDEMRKEIARLKKQLHDAQFPASEPRQPFTEGGGSLPDVKLPFVPGTAGTNFKGQTRQQLQPQPPQPARYRPGARDPDNPFRRLRMRVRKMTEHEAKSMDFDLMRKIWDDYITCRMVADPATWMLEVRIHGEKSRFLDEQVLRLYSFLSVSGPIRVHAYENGDFLHIGLWIRQDRNNAAHEEAISLSLVQVYAMLRNWSIHVRDTAEPECLARYMYLCHEEVIRQLYEEVTDDEPDLAKKDAVKKAGKKAEEKAEEEKAEEEKAEEEKAEEEKAEEKGKGKGKGKEKEASDPSDAIDQAEDKVEPKEGVKGDAKPTSKVDLAEVAAQLGLSGSEGEDWTEEEITIHLRTEIRLYVDNLMIKEKSDANRRNSMVQYIKNWSNAIMSQDRVADFIYAQYVARGNIYANSDKERQGAKAFMAFYETAKKRWAQEAKAKEKKESEDKGMQLYTKLMNEEEA